MIKPLVAREMDVQTTIDAVDSQLQLIEHHIGANPPVGVGTPPPVAPRSSTSSARSDQPPGGASPAAQSGLSPSWQEAGSAQENARGVGAGGGHGRRGLRLPPRVGGTPLRVMTFNDSMILLCDNCKVFTVAQKKDIPDRDAAGSPLPQPVHGHSGLASR